MLKELSEDLNNVKKIQSEMRDTPIEINKNLQGNKSRVDEPENQINDFEHKEAKNNHTEQREEKKNPPPLKNEDCVSSFWDNIKCSNICIIGVLEGEEKKQEFGNLSEKNNERKLP